MYKDKLDRLNRSRLDRLNRSRLDRLPSHGGLRDKKIFNHGMRLSRKTSCDGLTNK